MPIKMFTYAWKLQYLKGHLPDSTPGELAIACIDVACRGLRDMDEVNIEFPDEAMITVAETMARIGGLPTNRDYRKAVR